MVAERERLKGLANASLNQICFASKCAETKVGKEIKNVRASKLSTINSI